MVSFQGNFQILFVKNSYNSFIGFFLNYFFFVFLLISQPFKDFFLMLWQNIFSHSFLDIRRLFKQLLKLISQVIFWSSHCMQIIFHLPQRSLLVFWIIHKLFVDSFFNLKTYAALPLNLDFLLLRMKKWIKLTLFNQFVVFFNLFPIF